MLAAASSANQRVQQVIKLINSSGTLWRILPGDDHSDDGDGRSSSGREAEPKTSRLFDVHESLMTKKISNQIMKSEQNLITILIR